MHFFMALPFGHVGEKSSLMLDEGGLLPDAGGLLPGVESLKF